MKSLIPQFFGARTLLLSAAIMAPSVLQAASISLTSGRPRLDAFNGTLSYTYTAICANSSNGSFGICNTGAFTGAQNWSKSYGRFEITVGSTDLWDIVTPEGDIIAPVSDTNPGADYTLSVILGFNSDGSALSGILASDPWDGDPSYSSAAAAYGTTTDSRFDSGTILTGTPTNANVPPYSKLYPFGYGGQEDSGVFEFVLNNVGGDMAAFGNATGIIATTFDLNHPLLPNGLPNETWDSKGVAFWKQNFTASDIDLGGSSPLSVVPAPPAVWLLGTALAGLGGRRLLRRKITS